MSAEIKLIGKSDAYEGLYLVPIEEWSQFFEPCNWRTFHPVLFEIEDDQLMGGVEATLIILGAGLRVRWNYASTDHVAEIKRRVAEIGSDTPVSHTEERK